VQPVFVLFPVPDTGRKRSRMNRMNRVAAFISRFSLVLLLLMAPLAGSAQTVEEDAAAANIRTLLGSTQSGMVIGAIVPSPVAGLYEVTIQNGQTLYVSADAQFLIPGDLYQATADGLVNLGEGRRNELRKAKIAALDEADMIIYEPADGRKATITVFTDVDCPYCRKLHDEIAALNAYGIAVRYLAFPRTGLNTDIHFKMVSTWCSDDRKAMLTSAKRGGAVPETECESPVEEQYQLGREVGVTGTPALVLEDGTIMPGYVPADTLAQYLLNPDAQ
jgi:thiol:disulfide interchange protein DsbC